MINRGDIEKINNFISIIKRELEKQINEDYDEYKYDCLKDLDNKLEAKRNEVVKKVLDGIDINMMTNEPYHIEPTIMIRVEKKIVLNEENKND